MSQSDFNWTGYAAAVGKKIQADIELADRVQPVLVVGDLSLTTPQHKPPAGVGGQTQAPGAGFRAAFQVKSLDPGGCYVGAQFLTAAGFMRFRIVTPPTAGFISVGYDGQLSQNGLPVSQILQINRVAVLTNEPTWQVGSATQPTGDQTGVRLFIPRGHAIEWEHTNDQIPCDARIIVESVAATQGGDG